MFTRSTALTETHAFSTREGGISTGRFGALNLAAKWGDDIANVEENRRRFAVAVGFALAKLRTKKQVHGNHVHVIESENENESDKGNADAIATNVPGLAVGVFTADCVPILFSDGEGRVAAAHAGWRGTVAEIAVCTVEALVALGATRERLRAAIGPSICVRCFEVGEEVAAEFATDAALVVRRDLGPKPHVDLHLANRLQLERAGLARDRIDAAPPCTMCDPQRYFSFRRDGAGIGQQLSVIAAPARKNR